MIHGFSRFSALTLSVSLAVVLLACSGTKGIDASGPLDPAAVIAAVEARNAEVRALTGEGTISVDTPELANTGNIEVRILKPDSMLLIITGPFGMSVAKGLVTSSDFTFYNGLENSVATGATTAKNLKNIIRIPIEFRDIVDIASGTMGFERRPVNVIPTGAAMEGGYRLTYAGASESTTYDIDLEHSAVKRYLRKSAGGDIIEDVTFKDFRKKADLYLPTIITILRPGFSESISLVYERMSLNNPPLDFSIRIPKSATKIRF